MERFLVYVVWDPNGDRPYCSTVPPSANRRQLLVDQGCRIFECELVLPVEAPQVERLGKFQTRDSFCTVMRVHVGMKIRGALAANVGTGVVRYATTDAVEVEWEHGQVGTFNFDVFQRKLEDGSFEVIHEQ